ncbi:putative disease resistance RPP13-like protein 1 [Carex littledalei]|uniref:Putative disease resistance RPP13-like protein 1 n=1 Tax=Carex littledalei TaxID=544730 RepID=A0A833S032_9POAL|nr:putative disease resistance RPP13-like protein 1 [Carex littledalei]
MAIVLEAFLRRLTASFEEFVNSDACLMLGVREDAQKLLKTMLRIYEIGIIGERNQLKHPQIDLWISELKDAVYDIDDLVDICVIEGGKILLEDHPTPSPKCSFKILSCFKCAKYRHEIVYKIREINNRLKELEEASLSAIAADLLGSASPSKGTPVNFEDFGLDLGDLPVGRQIEKAANGLVQSMLKGSKKKVELFGVVGMAAIGKTTLARMVYNDVIIQENFPIRIWVSAKNLSERDLLKEIIKGAGGDPGEESATKEELVASLGSSLTKRFLVVLDDVYKPGIWETLLKVPLGDGVARGRVLIISRDVNVMKEMNTTIHQVERMDAIDGFELLCTEIFGYFDEDEIGLLKEVGVKIVEKCEGLPIAIKAVGGMLRTKERSEAEWEKVLERDSWSSLYQLPEEIPAALYVSYEDLPAYLKQCFLYCSLYPEDYPINRFHLIRHWIAEGLVTVPNGDAISIEDYAEECYQELIGRNMLQISPHNCHYCLIPHGVLRTLARFLITDESVFLEGGQRLIVTLLKPKRLALSNVEKNSLDDPISMKQQRCLRTILLINSPNVRLIDEVLLQTATSLRILDLSNTGIETLPPSIANLTHLRYLNLDRTKITDLSTLIGYLINLQTLSLRDCQSLHKLPKTINLLYELRCLCLKGTAITHAPKGIRNLTKLNHFDGFVLGDATDKTEGCTLDELHSLSELRYLHMENLERVKETKSGSFPLKNKASLRDVYLCWQPHEPVPVEEENQAEGEQEGENSVLVQKDKPVKKPVRDWRELSPSPSVEKLVLKHYPEQEFPTWLMTSNLPTSLLNLVYLDLFVCPSCTQIPPLGLLPQLKLLRISGADSIKTIGPEFLSTDTSSSTTLPAFEKLESLSIKQMASLEEWTFGSTETTPEIFPNLRSLEIINCPKLKSLPKGLGTAATSLRSLHIESAHSLTEIRNFPHLTNDLVIKDNKGLLRLSDLGSLKSLTIDDCQKLKHVNNLTALQRLSLVYPPSTETFYFEELIIFWSIEFPRWLSNMMRQHYVGPNATHNLKRFELTCSLPLLKSCMDGGKNWQAVQQIPEVRATTCDGKAYLWYSKNRRIYETNVGSDE